MAELRDTRAARLHRAHAADAEMSAILARLAAAPAVDLRAMPLDEARASFVRNQRDWIWAPAPMAETRELAVPGAAGALAARLHRPIADGDLPVVLFVHGGGWTFGSIDTHDGMMRCLALASGCAVLGFDYRLAPEHPFPAPLDDALAVLAHVEAGGLGPGYDRRRLALAGDSAGATLSLGALIARRDAGAPLPAAAALFYGCYAPIFDTPSHARNGDGRYLLRTEMMRWYWSNFLGPAAPQEAPGACAPLGADLSGLPPLYLNAAGLDPLLDDTTLLADRLAAAGTRFRLDVFPGVVHGFMRFGRDLSAARAAVAAAGAHLSATFADHGAGASDS